MSEIPKDLMKSAAPRLSDVEKLMLTPGSLYKSPRMIDAILRKISGTKEPK